MVVIVDWVKRYSQFFLYTILNIRLNVYKAFSFKILKFALFVFGFIIKPYDPQDSIDVACSTHDKCWEDMRNEKKCEYGLWEYYTWELAEGEV